MTKMCSLPLCVLAGVLLCSAAALAPQAAIAQQAATAPLAAPAVRITSPIDETQLVTLSHTVHPLANAANDRGAAPDGMQLDRLQLVLQRSPAQETALRQMISQMHTPGSPSYHQWLTPGQFGAQFGASDQDITTIETWLAGHGFAVSKVNPGKGTLEFSGSVAQMRDTFHTQIHKYVVNGETHYANANDPQIPAALAPVIGGFSSLNNFRPKSYIQKLGKAGFNPTTHEVTPQWTWGTAASSFYVLAPGDFAVQYDLNPLYSSNVNGTGQTIAIINESNINIDLVNQFRSLFGLPVNPPQIIIDGNDPGVDGVNNPSGPNYASFEAYLDVEWSGAVAPDATIDLVIAADTAMEDGLLLAMERAVYSNVAPVLSLSFGSCEASIGAYNGFVNALWEQAAAQGQTVMVSAGDSGSAGCDSSGSEFAVDGQAVNGFASTPYNVAVGGTDFYYSDYATGGASAKTDWNTTLSTSPAVSLLKPLPEQPWNDSQYGLNIVTFYQDETYSTETTIAAGSGGASNAAICSNNTFSSTGVCTGSMSGYPKPSWQTGTGVPSDGVRDLPDVALFSANGNNLSFYPICAEDGDCQPASGGNPIQISGVGGTSASAPSFAGIMALVNQQYGRQGQADNVLYNLKSQYPAAFHDITNGTNSVPCEFTPTLSPNCISVTSPISLQGSNGALYEEGQIGTGTTAEYNAAAGYNLATGLGTIDANVLVTDWNKITLAGTSTTLNATPTSFQHGSAVSLSGTVSETSGSKTPTGNVALMSDSTEPIQQGQGLATTLNGFVGSFPPGTYALNSSGQYSGSASTLPGGTYNIWTSYGGDSSNAGSLSAKTQITVTPETSGIFFQAISPAGTATAGSSAGTSVDYGTQILLSAQPAPTSKNQLSNFETCTSSCPVFTIPTGTVTFTDSGTSPIPAVTQVLNAEGDAEYNAPFAVGAHSVTASYSGDKSYNASTASAITLTVVKDTPTLLPFTTITTTAGDLISGPGQQTIITVQVANNAQYSSATSTGIYPVPVAPPTGTITLSNSSISSLNTSAPLSAYVDPSTGAESGVANFLVPANTAAGNYTVTIAYSGDTNYNGIAASSNTTLNFAIYNTANDGGLNSTTTATMTGSISPNSTILVTGSVSGPASNDPAPTGYIYVYSSGNYPTAIFVNPSVADTSTFSVALNSTALFQGANFVTLQYSGDSHYNPSAFVLNNNSAINNPLADFSLVPNSTIVPVSISAGANSGTDTINVTSINGFNGTVNLTCKATSPLTCSISPNPSLSAATPATSTLTINVPASAPNGNYDVLVTGVDATTSEFIHTLAITADVSGSGPAETLTNSGNVTVTQGATTGNTSTITVTPSGGFTGVVNLTCAVTSQPTNGNLTCSAAANLSPTSVDITSTGALTSTLAVATTSSTTPGSYQITVTGTSGGLTSTTVVNVTVNLPQDFALSNSGAISTNAGATTGNTATIAASALNGFTGTINLTCVVTTSPTGAAVPLTCSTSNLSPTSVVLPGGPTTSTLTASTTSSTTPGGYIITVTGTSGSDVHTTTVQVSVFAAQTPSFTVSATSPSAISPGSSGTSNITVSAGTTGYAGTVTLACTPSASNPTNQSGDAPTCTITYTTGSSITLTSGTTSGTATASVSTTAASAYLVRPNFFKGDGWLGAGGGAVLALLVFFGIPARRRSWRSMLGILVALVALGMLSSCGGGSSGGGNPPPPNNPGTTAGTYTFTITGTGNPTVSPAPTGTFTVSVN